MGFYLFSFVTIFLILLVIEAGILVFVEKRCGAGSPKYTITFLASALSFLVCYIGEIIVSLLNLGTGYYVVPLLISFIPFHFVLRNMFYGQWKKTLIVWLIFVITFPILATAVVLPLRIFVVMPVVISGSSMSPAHSTGDYVLVNMMSKKFERGDVVVFRNPLDSSIYHVQRIIGLPLEKIEISDGKVFINGIRFAESQITMPAPGGTSITLGEDEYYVLGDNRGKSLDSRLYGPVKKTSIEGKVF